LKRTKNTTLQQQTAEVWSAILERPIDDVEADRILEGVRSLIGFLTSHVDMEGAVRDSLHGSLKNVHETFEKVKGGQK